MFVVKRFTFQDAALKAQAFAIRHAVFVREQGIAAALEYDQEEAAHHYLLLHDHQPVATARWRKTGPGIKLERFAVLSPCRNRGIGAFLLQEVLSDVSAAGEMIYLHAQLRAVPFYERNGFHQSGNPFTEAGLAHFLMEYAV